MRTCVQIDPAGTSPLDDDERRNIMRVRGGDDITLKAYVELDGEAATPENSILEFAIADTRFTDVIWYGRWGEGIELVGNSVLVNVPRQVSESLRRGSYRFSLRVSDPHGNKRTTALDGTVLVEYSPTSPHQNIPY
jgi:hypothetical protein